MIQARSPFRFYGPDVQHMCDKLEARFRELYGVDHTLAVSSGTEAIYISLAAMDVGPGDEVLIPGYLWTSCINGIVRLGAIRAWWTSTTRSTCRPSTWSARSGRTPRPCSTST